MKPEHVLAWNKIQRRVVAKVNLEVADYRERRLNELLPPLYDEFQAALASGELLELNPADIVDITDAA